MLCTDLTLVNQNRETTRIMPLRCKCWTCEHCAPNRRRQLIELVKAGCPNTFITLTANPKVGANPEARAQDLVQAWRKVRAEIIAKYGYPSVPFIAVFEATKAGEPHLHILARLKWVDQGWLSGRMKHHIHAPICDVRRVETPVKAAKYITKYVGKAPHHFAGTKRYWRSLDYIKPEELPEDPDDDWDFWDTSFEPVDWLVKWHSLSGKHEATKKGDVWTIHHPPP